MNRKSALIVMAFLILLAVPAGAQSILDEYLPFTHTGAQGIMPYRLRLPEQYAPGESYPLILFLHGWGERGNDNIGQVDHSAVRAITNSIDAYGHQAFVLAPQADASGWVTSVRDGNLRMALNIIDEVSDAYGVDADRIYLTGLSNGGAGTWSLALNRPELFAAVIPICPAGGMVTSKASAVVDKPLWVFHAEDDGAAPIGPSKAMISAIEAAGGNPLYTWYATGGHGIWTRAYQTEQLWDWTFDQALPEPATAGMLLGGALALIRRRAGRTPS